MKHRLVQIMSLGFVVGAAMTALGLPFLMTGPAIGDPAVLWTTRYQAQAPLLVPDQWLEVWTQQPPDTAWSLDHVQPLESAGEIAVWVTTLTKIKARTYRVIHAVPASILLPALPEQYLYGEWSNELRFSTTSYQLGHEPAREHIR